MKLTTSYKDFDWLIIVTDYDYDPAEPQTRDHPGCFEQACITDGYVQLDGSGAMVSKINKQLCERGSGPLFDMLVELDNDALTDQLLDVLYDRAEAEERDWEAEAEEAEWRRAEEFNNKEVAW